MKEVNIISKVVGRSGAEASPSSAIMPNMSGYATKTELNTLRNEFKDFLEGADADVVINKWQDLVSFLEGISEDFDLLSMLGLKADKSELSNYVTLATKQTITGEKNFTGGLKVNGSPIVYDATNKYWKLEGDLLVTGGVTMYASDSAFTPSTIMGAIATDGTNLKVVNGVLTFVGKTGGGVADSVLWDNVEGKPSWITDTKPSYSYSEISGTPTLLSSFIDDVGYLQKSGGQMTGNIGYNSSRDTSEYGIPFAGTVVTDIVLTNGAFNDKKSFLGGTYYVPDSVWYHTISVRHRNGYNEGNTYGMYIVSTYDLSNGNLIWNKQYHGVYQGDRVILDSVNWKDYVSVGNGGISGNVLTVDGSDYRGGYPALRMHIPNVNWQQFMMRGDGIVELRYGDGGQSGRWGQLALGTLFFDDQRDDVLYFPEKEYFDKHGNIHIPNADGSWSWNIYNSNGSNIMVVYTNGNIISAGGITMYSDQRKKTILNHVELSLEQIADAPLIEHYYNSDAMRTTHVGSIAQYWAGLNDWFCKLDSEGYYTMEIQNAALASAISIARELVKYESKTDRKIRLLKQRVKELEEKIEKLENN